MAVALKCSGWSADSYVGELPRGTSGMYDKFFGFKHRPFAAAPTVDGYFAAAGIEVARQTLLRIVQRAEGPGMVIGPAGTGKSLLCQLLARELSDRFRVIVLANSRLCTRRALLKSILFELGLPHKEKEEGELRLALIDYLEPGPACPHGLLLIIDEADAMPTRLLEEIRMITNLVRNGEPRVRLVLAGGPALEERFASPRLESFNQRIAARCYLHALGREETIQLARHQVQVAGGDPDAIFEPDALAAIHTATDGVPRLINQVCDHALLLAQVNDVRRINAALVEEAWADLQQLPPPWYDAAAPDDGQRHVIEFGQLGDDFTASTTSTLNVDELDDPAPSKFGVVADLDEIQRHVSQLDDDSRIEIVAPPFAMPPVTVSPVTVSPAAVRPGTTAPMTAPPMPAPRHAASPVAVPLATARVAGASPRLSDPFGGLFDEEEVVIDRYAELDAEFLRDAPRVRSSEGLEIAAVLASGYTPSLTIVGGPSIDTVGIGTSNILAPAIQSLAATPSEAATPAGDWLARKTERPAPDLTSAAPGGVIGGKANTSDASPDDGDAGDDRRAAGYDPLDFPELRRFDYLETPRSAAARTPASSARVAELWETELGDDRDVIVIEDPIEAGAAKGASSPSGRARRQEYRQLFARLRQRS